MSAISTLQRITLRYKTTQGVDLYIDVWAPPNYSSGSKIHRRPAFVYFHGGGLCVGARDIWIPEWIFNRFTDRGYIFISADYRLLPSSTGYDIVDDIKDLWAYITSPDLDIKFPSSEGHGETTFKIDTGAIAVGGSSAGAYAAILTAIHCKNPKPKAILSVYGMAGQIFSSHYLSPKKDMFVHSLEFLDKANFEEYVYPYAKGKLPVVAQSYPTYAADHPLGPSYPADPRMQLVWLYLQNGVILDYVTGQHSPSLSALLRDTCGLEAPASTSCSGLIIADKESQKEAEGKIDAKHLRGLFPQFNVSSDWPAVAFIHGVDDSAVPILDSEHLHGLLKDEGVPSEIYPIKGQEHAFDLIAEDPEAKWGTEFEEAVEFVHQKTIKIGD